MKLIEKEDKKIFLALATIVIIGSYLRFRNILLQSFWNDELYSIFVSQPSRTLKEIILFQTKDAHPPLYQMLLWINFKIFGYSELTARGFSAALGIAGIATSYFLFKKLFDKYTALLGTAVSSATVLLIWYSQETRSYSLLYFLTVLSSFLFLTFYEKQTTKNFFMYSLSATALAYTHYFGFLILLSHGLTTLYILLTDKKRGKAFFFKMLLAGLFVTILYIPWFPYLFKNRMISKTWIKPPKPSFFFTYVFRYWKSSLKIVLLVFVIGTTGAFISFFSNKRINKENRLALVFLIISLFCSYAIPYFFSIYKTPVLITRVTIIGVPFLIGLFCYPFFFWRKKEFLTVFSLGILLIMGTNIIKHKEIERYLQKEQAREMLFFLKENYCNKKFKAVFFSHYWEYLTSYSKMLNLNLKISFPYPNKFYKTFEKLKNNDRIIVIKFHNFNKNINKEIYSFIKKNCLLEREKEFKKIKAEIYVKSKVTTFKPKKKNKLKSDKLLYKKFGVL